MLRAKERSESRRTPRPAHLLTAGMLLSAGLLASTLRGPQLTAASEVDSEKPALAQSPAAPPVASFDLSFVPPDSRGVVAMRPAALFRQPGMQKYALMLNGAIAAQLLTLGKKSFGLSAADIEQMVFPLNLLHNPKAAKGRRREMVIGPGGMIRSVKDFNWQKQVRAWLPGLTEAHHGGVTYYRIPKEFPAFGPDACLLFPDARTVVGMGEKELRRMIDRGEYWKKTQDWGKHWKHVEQDLFAVTFRTENLLSEKEDDDPAEIALVRASERLTAGVESSSTLKVHFWVQCRSGQGSEKWEQHLRTQLKERVAEKKQATKPQEEQTAQEKAFDTIEAELLSGLRLARGGAQLEVRSGSPRSFANLVELFMTAIMQDAQPHARKPAK